MVCSHRGHWDGSSSVQGQSKTSSTPQGPSLDAGSVTSLLLTITIYCFFCFMDKESDKSYIHYLDYWLLPSHELKSPNIFSDIDHRAVEWCYDM